MPMTKTGDDARDVACCMMQLQMFCVLAGSAATSFVLLS